tara:strand:+ start:50 stop:361 length:312 start_codon:yes stop_codon:yes gene_type:complete
MIEWKNILKATRGAAKKINHPVFTQAVENVTKDRKTFKLPLIAEEVVREYASLLVEGGHMTRTNYATKHAKARVNKETIGQKINKLGYHKRNKNTGFYERIRE